MNKPFLEHLLGYPVAPVDVIIGRILTVGTSCFLVYLLLDWMVNG